MEFTNTDNTQTNWDEFKLENKSECCPVTGVSTALGYMLAEYSGATLDVSHTVHGGRSKSKLQAMFDKFLYQK